MEWSTWRFIMSIVLQSASVASVVALDLKIGQEIVNVVDKNFLSFTVDPKYLFSGVDAFHKKERACMASFLTPAYLRIAGPSSSHLTFRNSTLTLHNAEEQNRRQNENRRQSKHRSPKTTEISDDQWIQFVKWANRTGFDIVFALDTGKRSESGLWDPNATSTLLSIAENANIKNVFWQLGYECRNQPIDEYLNDLETLRLVVDAASSGKRLGWRVVGGDVTPCFGQSGSDFKRYVTRSMNITGAVMLDGNSSYYELGRLQESDRLELLDLLHTAHTPLWMTEPSTGRGFEQAADWLTSLGYSARNGFHAHYRELVEEDFDGPSLSFYMALLFKNLVGDRVLPVESISGSSDAAQLAVFAHCTSLRQQPVPGAMTLYAVNMDHKPSRLTLKLSDREEGGEIMQFILRNDKNGNIIVNNRIVNNKTGIRLVLKRVFPYKALAVNLPPNSFGFWVLANTNITACGSIKKEGILSEESKNHNNIEKNDSKDRNKRFIKHLEENSSNDDDLTKKFNNAHVMESEELKERIDNVKNELKEIYEQLEKRNRTKATRSNILEKFRDTNNIRQYFNTLKDAKVERKHRLRSIDNVLKKHKIHQLFNKNREHSREQKEKSLSRKRRHILEDLKIVKTLQEFKENAIGGNSTNNVSYLIGNAFQEMANLIQSAKKSSATDDSLVKIDENGDSVTIKIKSPFNQHIVKDLLSFFNYFQSQLEKYGHNVTSPFQGISGRD